MDEESKRQSVTMDDLSQKKYISLKIGESAEFTVKAFEQVKCDEKFALPAKEIGEKLDYRYEITTTEDEVLPISAWVLYGAIRTALVEANVETPVGVKLSIVHTGMGKYDVKVV